MYTRSAGLSTVWFETSFEQSIHTMSQCFADGNVVLLHNFLSHDFPCPVTWLLHLQLPVTWLDVQALLDDDGLVLEYAHGLCYRIPFVNWSTKDHAWRGSELNHGFVWSLSTCAQLAMVSSCAFCACGCAYVSSLELQEAVNETWMDDGNLIMTNYSHVATAMFCQIPASINASWIF